MHYSSSSLSSSSSVAHPCIATTDVVPIPLFSFPPFHLQSNPSILPLSSSPPFFRIFSPHPSSSFFNGGGRGDGLRSSSPSIPFPRLSNHRSTQVERDIPSSLNHLSLPPLLFPFLCPFPLPSPPSATYNPSLPPPSSVFPPPPSLLSLSLPLPRAKFSLLGAAARTRLTGCCPP